MFFVIVIAWALAVSGLAETASMGARGLRRAARGLPKTDADARTESRDGLTVGILTLILGLGLLFVPADVRAATTRSRMPVATFTLTGITIAVGVFGAYAAIVAVYLAIAGFSPRNACSRRSSPRRRRARSDIRESATGERGRHDQTSRVAANCCNPLHLLAIAFGAPPSPES